MSKRAVLTTIIIPSLLISGLIIFLINNQKELPGVLALSQTRLDFGTVPEWKGQVTKTVLARNTGKSPLNIHKIQTGCSYAIIEGPMVIPPDSETAYKVILNPQLLPTDTATATAIFFTDSNKTPQVYLTIEATAKRFATLSAEVCDFGEILHDTSYEKRVKLCVNEPLNHQEIRLLPAKHPMLTWMIVPDVNSDCYILTIQLRITKNDRKTGDLFSVLLTVAFPNERTLTLPIVGKIAEPIIAKPESLSYGVVNSETTPSLIFSLTAKSNFKVTSVQTPDFLKVVEIPNIHVSETDSPDFVRQFKVSWEVSKSPTLLREVIYINTSIIPICIPIYGYIHADQPTNPSSVQRSE